MGKDTFRCGSFTAALEGQAERSHLLAVANQQNIATSVFGASNTSWSENQITWNNKPSPTTNELAKRTILRALTTLGGAA